MKKILLPTDFSENSWNAISYALELFKKETCTFYLLNTFTPAIYHIEYVLVNPAQFGMVDSAKETSVKNLSDIKARIHTAFNNPNHTIKILSVFNALVSEIKDQVAEKNIDVIVMGTKGATGAKEVLFGSNTVHVLNQVKCPVLGIPDTFKYENPHELLFPTDYEIEFKKQHINTIVNIAMAHTSRVNVLHVSYGSSLNKTQQKNKAILEQKISKVAHIFHDVSNLNVEDAIIDFQMKNKINMLVMINNKHSFFENLFFKKLIHHIGFHIKTPFLVIPSKITSHYENKSQKYFITYRFFG